jgi:hypothetical protein
MLRRHLSLGLEPPSFLLGQEPHYPGASYHRPRSNMGPALRLVPTSVTQRWQLHTKPHGPKHAVDIRMTTALVADGQP